jgi:hypothetical protein
METRIINGNACRLHHTALFRGYISRQIEKPIYEEYDGRFGRGFKELRPNRESTQYSIVVYWILEDTVEAVA